MEKSLAKKMFEIQNLHLKYEKDAENPFFKSKYLSLDSLWNTLSPELEKRNLLVVHHTVNKEVGTTVIDIDSDDRMTSAMPLPENIDPQKLGSAVTYFKRYNLGQLFNILTDDDDDGNMAKPQVKKTPAPATTQSQDESIESIIGQS